MQKTLWLKFALEKLSVPIFEAAPQPFLLNAGRAPGRRRRVLCSACFSSPLSALSIVISNFNSCVFVVSYAMVSTNRFTVAVSHPPLVTAHPLVISHPLKANRSTGSRTTRSAHFLGTVKSPLGVQPEPPLLHHVSSPSQPFEPLVIYSLRQLHPNRSLDVSFQSFVMGLRFSSGLDESYGFQYGNIGVHCLSLISVRILSWNIVKSIAPPLPSRLVTPFPSEICCYSTASFTHPSHLNADTAYGLSDICFWLGLAHLLVCEGLLLKSTHSWPTKNFPMSDVIKLRHRSSSEASCRSTVCRLVSYKVHLAPSCDVVQGSPSPSFMSIRFKSRQRRPFSMAFSYVSGVTHLFLPPISPYLRQSSIENSGRAQPPLFQDNYFLVEAKESVSSPVFVSANRFKTLSIGPLIVGFISRLQYVLGTSVSGSQVKHLYGYLHPFNTSITRIVVVVFVYRLAVEFTSGLGLFTFQVFLYPSAERLLGPAQLNHLAGELMIPVQLSYPFIAHLSGVSRSILLSFAYILVNVFSVSAITGMVILQNRAVRGYCSAVFNALFGMGTNIWMAIATRFMLGSFNCLLGTVKAYATEIFREEYQAMTMSAVNTAWELA
ncbi:hypothetical protein HID58_039186 [Brassica napus]|uniref:Uncharacterized protein n=1 Tax=Brassica napus TaxID=3708 RepID=A0ABQ8BRD3_BRANA|nr:hypothetical protein HID58_039186 [Brassica napus]